MQRFFLLPPADQLRAFKTMRAYLKDAVDSPEALADSPVDKKLDEQAGALEALDTVARKLKLPSGQAPTPAQFDKAARDVAPGWNRSRVTRAFGRWRWACDRYRGVGESESARQRGVRRALGGGGRPLTSEEHLTALRLWLTSSPIECGIADYDRWQMERNGRLKPGEQRAPKAKQIIERFWLPWPDLVAIARGELDLEKTLARRWHELRKEGNENEDGLVGLAWIGVFLGLAATQIQYLTRSNSRFPVHILTLGDKRIWLRADVEAFRAKRAVSKRRVNELQHLYLDRSALARLLGISWQQAAVAYARHLPPPAGEINGKRYWRRAEVDEWLTAGGLDTIRTRRRHTSPRASQ